MPYVPGLLSAINPIHQFELDGKKSGMLYASKEISFRLNRLAESINGVISELAETCFIVLLFYKVLTSGSSLMNKYADHAFNGILKVSFTIVGDSMSLYVILIGVTLDVFPVAYILERPF